ncbi:MAG: NAD-glutamate dehydrogenase [Alphaproteobacteria bacterium]
MALRMDGVKDEAIERIVDTVRSKMAGNKATTAEAFVRRFYEDVATDDLINEESEDLYGAALSLWSMAATRQPGETKLRVYNPRFDQHGWHSTHTVIEIVNDDMPFLVDSVTSHLNQYNTAIHQLIHPVMATERDRTGAVQTLCAVGKADKDAIRESFIHVQIDAQPTPAALKALEGQLRLVLGNVRAAVEDWQAMRHNIHAEMNRLKTAPPQLEKAEIDEAVAFLEWLYDDHYTFLGYRRLDFIGTGKRARMAVVPGSGLGILRDPEVQVFEGLRNLGAQSQAVQDFVRRPELLVISKTTERATVHRSVHMDTVAIKLFDDSGNVIGEHLFAGLLTSVAYSQSPMQIPMLRDKVTTVVRNSGFDLNGHNGKALLHVLEDYPRDELFQSSVEELTEVAHSVVQLHERPRIALFVRCDPFERYVSATVYLPRDRMSTTLRLRFESILSAAFGGPVRAFHMHMADDPLGRLQFVGKTTPGAVPEFDTREIEARLVDAARSWEDKLKQALVEHLGEARGAQLSKIYSTAFDAGYQESYSAKTAVYDIERIEEALASGKLGMNLYRPIEASENALSFKVYNAGDPIALSDILPRLENMGLKVVSEEPSEVNPDGVGRPVYMHDFGLVSGDAAAPDVNAIRDAFHDSFARIWSGEMEDDGFNRLVLIAGLDWREVVVLRAYCKFLHQTGIPFSQSYVEATLARHPDLVRLLIRLFKLRFDPDFEGDREGLADRLLQAIEQELERVSNLDEDRILRLYQNLIQSTLRTSFFQTGPDGSVKSYLSMKYDSRKLEELPKPKPLREISVYSPRFEAVHMRFGLVARGGLRWSDRREDFRTEILGLVKAQQVKNSVIVPVGSKGGFVLKQAPSPQDREAFQAEGVACYRLFMSAMLDITDNLVEGKIVPPQRVVRMDGDDPYLVVAADKGTATFSDIANEIAISYGFWLGDAFASGGSVGYDHKKMGITAKGAWESVKRHFREMGHDTQTQPFTVVGCGDMSGDVFGNGMLLSNQIRLVGAFNHMHIFIDPDPDPAATLAERQRLFDLPRSSWSDYDPKLISKGGGVFDRSAKTIALTPEIRRLFGIEASSVPPNTLISAMLRAEVDLLWFGGIGTYIKASTETHGDAGDRANDGLRVDGRSLRCRVVGEGANLGVTQRGRIEFARNGGRINTDAVDNSAGVDCSDHEVNIKILLDDIVARGDMTVKQRNDQLAAMTDEVGALCLADNYAQGQAITVIASQAHRLLDRHQRLMRSLERAEILDRSIEYLPDDETIDTLQATQQGLTRPEIAVLLAYAKNTTYEELLHSDLPDDPLLVKDLQRYFPQPLRDGYRDAIRRHTLRREIIATAVTNSMINRTGPSFVSEMRERSGMDTAAVARAFTVVREVFGLRPLWTEIEALDNVATAEAQTLLLREIDRTVDRNTQWFLRNTPQPLDITRLLEAFGPGITALGGRMEDILQPDQLEDVARRTQRLALPGVPELLSKRVGALKMLSTSCDVICIAAAAGLEPETAARVYFQLGSRFRLDWLRRGANRLTPDSSWHKLAVEAIIDDLWNAQSALTGQVLAQAGAGADALDNWAKARKEACARVERLLADLDAVGQVDLAMLAVANRELRGLVTG